MEDILDQIGQAGFLDPELLEDAKRVISGDGEGQLVINELKKRGVDMNAVRRGVKKMTAPKPEDLLSGVSISSSRVIRFKKFDKTRPLGGNNVKSRGVSRLLDVGSGMKVFFNENGKYNKVASIIVGYKITGDVVFMGADNIDKNKFLEVKDSLMMEHSVSNS